MLSNNLEYWGWLSLALSPQNSTKWSVLKDFSPELIYDMVLHNENPGFSPIDFRKLKSCNLHYVQQAFEDCYNEGINIYCPEDSAYPEKLFDIYNPPTILFSYGDLGAVDFNISAAVIGSRNADDYALYCAGRLSSELASKGVSIISGFARGIDSSAHNGALRGGGQTVAVLGCGIQYDYPRGTKKFKERIAENGAVISEYMPYTEPSHDSFKVRNRIISGLSDGIVVISAGMKSGTLNTISHGNSQGKDVFVLPPMDIFNENYQGNISLLRDGATPVYSYEDILTNLKTD